MTGLLDADRASLYLVDKQKQELWTKVAQGMGVRRSACPWTSGIAGHVARTGTAMNVADAYQDPLFNQEIDQKTGYRTKSVLSVPIRDDRNEVIGVISAFNSTNGTFSADDEASLDARRNVLGLALRNSVLYEAVVDRQKEVSTLLEVGASLSGTLELAELIADHHAQGARDHGRRAQHAVPASTRRRASCVSKVAEGQAAEIRVPKGQGIAGQVAATGQAAQHPRRVREPAVQPGGRPEDRLPHAQHPLHPHARQRGPTIGVTQVINKKAAPSPRPTSASWRRCRRRRRWRSTTRSSTSACAA